MTTPSAPETGASPAALQKLEPRLRALSTDRLTPPRGDAKIAALAALGVADRLAAPEARAKFARLPKEEFDPAHLEDLRTAAWAVWNSREALDAAVAKTAEQPLPPALIERALPLKERMIRVLSYYFAEDADLKRPLQQMQRRKGNAELPADLSRLGKLYRERKSTIEADTKHYRAGDADEADGIAAEAAQLAASRRGEAETKATDLLARAFTLLLSIYDEVRAAGLYLYRHENAAELFPNVAALPAPRGRPRKAGAAAAAASAEEGPKSEPPPSEPPPAAAPKSEGAVGNAASPQHS
jgi:hypothetical protein